MRNRRTYKCCCANQLGKVIAKNEAITFTATALAFPSFDSLWMSVFN